MLKRVEKQNLKDLKDACVLAKDAKFPSPFDSKLEFSCSARGLWNIVHTEVNSKYQGQGIARKLVENVIENAHKNNKQLKADCSYARRILEKQ